MGQPRRATISLIRISCGTCSFAGKGVRLDLDSVARNCCRSSSSLSRRSTLRLNAVKHPLKLVYGVSQLNYAHTCMRIRLTSEFAAVEIALDDAGNGPRLMIRDLLTGQEIYLDPLELAALAWIRHEELLPLLDPGRFERRLKSKSE